MGRLKVNHKKFIKSNKLPLQSQKTFISDKHNVSTEEVNKAALSANYNKIIKSIDQLMSSCSFSICRKSNFKNIFIVVFFEIFIKLACIFNLFKTIYKQIW